MPDLCLVQASHVLPDADVIAALPSLTKWSRLVTDAYALAPATFSFMTFADFQLGKAAGAWPLFLNKHSTDPTALGFHDTLGGEPYGRSFSGDDILDGISPWVTLSHEAGEMIVDPYTNSIVHLKDGSMTIREICDAVEDDIQAITIDNLPWSNFVYPEYWDDVTAHPPGTRFDCQCRLSGPCPSLTPGGYVALLRPGQPWSQVTDRRIGSRASVRADRHMTSHRARRMMLVPIPGSAPP